MTTDAAVGKKVGRVGKDGVEASGVAILGIDGVEEFEGVAVVKPEAAVGVGVSELRRRRFYFFNGGRVAVQVNRAVFA